MTIVPSLPFTDWLIGLAGSIESIANNELGIGAEDLTEVQYGAIMRYASSSCENGVFPDRCEQLKEILEWHDKHPDALRSHKEE